MTPTNRLRFVEREVQLHPFYKTVNEKGEFVPATQTVQILQQWWEVENLTGAFYPQGVAGEWRDVPIEQEEVK